MLAVSLKWRLGVVRRRPKGTKLVRGANGMWGRSCACPGAGRDLGLGGG